MWEEISYPSPNFNGATGTSLGMDKQSHSTLCWACDYLSILRLKLNHVSKRGPRSQTFTGKRSVIWVKFVTVLINNLSQQMTRELPALSLIFLSCVDGDSLILTLNVQWPSHLDLTMSISWLLMPWLLTSPGHQQLWYWLCRICKSWSYLKTSSSLLFLYLVEEFFLPKLLVCCIPNKIWSQFGFIFHCGYITILCVLILLIHWYNLWPIH